MDMPLFSSVVTALYDGQAHNRIGMIPFERSECTNPKYGCNMWHTAIDLRLRDETKAPRPLTKRKDYSCNYNSFSNVVWHTNSLSDAATISAALLLS